MMIKLNPSDIYRGIRHTITSPRMIDARNRNPGTIVAIYPTAETYRNIADWAWHNDVLVVKKPYGLLHTTLLSTAKTVDLPIVKLDDPIYIEPHQVRLHAFDLSSGDRDRRFLVAKFRNPVLDEIYTALHRAVNVRPHAPPHMTLSFKWSGKRPLPPPPAFAIALQSTTINSFTGGFQR